MAYIAAKKIIESGHYEKEKMMENLDLFLLGNRITKTQYEELVTMITEASETNS